MVSIRTQVVAWALRFLEKPALADERKTRSSIRKPKRDPHPPPSFNRFRVEKKTVAGFDCFSIAPASGTVRQAVMYLHGGAYFGQIRREHWKFIGQLVEKSGCRVDVPLYGLAPNHTWREAFPFLIAVYEEMLTTVPAESVTFMGDSAGGALCVALSQTAAKAGLPNPGRLVLLSPWLDLSLSNPDIPAIEPCDPWLTQEGLLTAGQAWADGEVATNPKLSPIYGDLRGLPPMDLYIGTCDVLWADCRRFRDLAQEQGVAVDYYEVEGAFHVYPLAPVPEGRKAAAQILASFR
jgi:acetyl esterase/lipase